jgi:hypothetical protein
MVRGNPRENIRQTIHIQKRQCITSAPFAVKPFDQSPAALGLAAFHRGIVLFFFHGLLSPFSAEDPLVILYFGGLHCFEYHFFLGVLSFGWVSLRGGCGSLLGE